MIDKNLGAVTAYAIAKEHGYTGTETEFAEQITGAATNAQLAASSAAIASTKASEASNSATAANTAKQGTETAAQQAQTDITTAKGAAITAINGAKDASIDAVNSTKGSAIGDIDNARTSAVTAINTATQSGQTAISTIAETKVSQAGTAIDSKKDTAITAIDGEAATQKSAVTDEGTKQVGLVTAEGEKQKQEVEQAAPNKVDKNQGTDNAGKALVVGADGMVYCGEAGVSVDTTLTQAGKAADAKSAGDAITAIKQDLVNLEDTVGESPLSEETGQRILDLVEDSLGGYSSLVDLVIKLPQDNAGQEIISKLTAEKNILSDILTSLEEGIRHVDPV